MLHLGDQIYSKDNNWKGAAMRVMDLLASPEARAKPALVAKVQTRAFRKLQEGYKATWAHSTGVEEAAAGLRPALRYSLFGALIFSGYIIFDTFLITQKFGYDDYIFASVTLYLDLVNLFFFILQMLSQRRE